MISLALAYLAQRKLATSLNVLLVALAVALLTLLLLVSSQATQRLTRAAAEIDLVVGAKGSPLQLILSSVFHVDQPTGNIPRDTLTLLRSDPGVARATPLALGDSFRGFRIVGTDESFLELKGAAIAEGALFRRSHEAVIGATVARETGARLGQRFVGSHGLSKGGHAHVEAPFTVVGVLAPTGGVADRLILTSVETVWRVHGIHDDHDLDDHARHDHDHAHAPEAAAGPALQARPALEPELTAILVTYANSAAAIRLPSTINRQTALQAAAPAVETGRLLALFGASVAGLQILGWTLAAIAGLAIFAALFAATQARAGDLALLRVMGASRATVTATVLLEAIMAALAGAILGVLLAHGLLWTGAARFEALRGFGIDPLQPHWGALWIVLATLVIAIAAALIPALRVYRADIVRTLARAA